MSGAGYESEKLLAEYLLFHYGTAAEVLPYEDGPHAALGYPVRCVTECFAGATGDRALDLGCAVGRSSFEFARSFREVVGIDLSQSFIRAADALKQTGELPYLRSDEGALRTPLTARISSEIDRARVQFETGDATALRSDLGSFDAVLMANLIDRLSDPAKCLAQLPGLVRPGGQLVITSPYTWLEDFTPPARWLGGYERDGTRVSTLSGLDHALAAHFDLQQVRDLPFLIREHARKFQWSVAQASIWRRKP
jgi:putative 4-mercaptohistidine N1-methyltranferase